MGKTDKDQAKDAPAAKEIAQEDPGPGFSHRASGLGKLYIPGLALRNLKKKPTCCNTCLKVLFVALAFVVIIKSIAVIAVTMTTALATRIYSSELSGRLVAMIVLAVTAAVSLSIAIYAMIAVFRRQNKPLHAAGVVLFILAVIQAVIAGVSVRVTADDEVGLSRSLSESFRLAREDSPRHVKIWATTQHDLNCCGVYSAEDYRTPKLPFYFSPDVPISCCPGYDPDRSELVQEREREKCKSKKEFYDIGCKNLVVEVFKETATMVLSVTIGLIILEVILSILGAILSRERKGKELRIVEDGTETTIPIETKTSPKKPNNKTKP